jgi:hypothetical protein
MPPTAQLRIYTIEDGHLEEFCELWRREVRPLRLAFGFSVDGAWLDRDANRFVWVISYAGPNRFEDRDAAYYESPERAAFDPDPAELVVRSETAMLEPLAAR